MTTKQKQNEVIVVGGGYAGVIAANRLTKRADVAVTLVNPRPAFVERIRLHQLAAGNHPATVPYADVLSPKVRLAVDTATRIGDGRVTLASGAGQRYDYLIYAVGSGSLPPPPAAYPLATLEDAQRLRAALDGDVPTITVVGGGPTGIETAAELGRRVTLVCAGELGPYLHPRGRREVARRLAELGVTVIEHATVTAVTPDAVRLADGRELPSAVTVWTAGFGVPDLAARSGLSTDPLGRLRTDETLTSIDDDRIVAAGDSAAPSDRPLRMSCQAAGPLGMYAAETVLSRIAGRDPAPIAMGFVGQCLSLGRRYGLFQFAHRDDTARNLQLSGRAAAKLKEFVCWGTVKQLAIEARRPGTIVVPSFAADPNRRRELVP